MNIHDLRVAQVQFESLIPTLLEQKKHLYNLRDSFVKYYTLDRIRQMPLDHYALGNDLPKSGYNFCYTLERELDGLGRIIGATSFKFGIYYGKIRSDGTNKYRYTKKFGDDQKSAYEQVKQSIIELITAGANEDLEAIVDNRFSPMFKGKILSTYYPDRYLNIFSDDHLEYFLIQLNIDTHDLIWSDAVLKREALVKFKNEDKVMKDWPLDVFMSFLYEGYPGRPPKENGDTGASSPLDDYRNPNFPPDAEPCWIEMEFEEPTIPKSPKGTPKSKSNPDYEKEARQLKKLGDRGEKIVLDMEIDRLIGKGKPDLAKMVKKAEFDYLGYDIRSFEVNGEPRYIEVKATRSKVGAANFFLSSNEYSMAKDLPNYNVYMVYDILSIRPRVWVIPNPFKPANNQVMMTPVTYRIVINAKKKK